MATRLHHWSLYLSQFNYDVQYRKSADRGNADALSRLTTNPPTHTFQIEAVVQQLTFDILSLLPVTASTIRQATSRDPALSNVMQLCLYGWPKQLSQHNKNLQPFHTRKEELTVVQGVLQWGIRVVIPTTLQQRVLQQLHECHFGVVKMKALARQHVW